MGNDSRTTRPEDDVLTEETIERVIKLAPPTWRVFEAFTHEINEWWCHRPRGATIHLEPFEGGSLYCDIGGERTVLGTIKRIERDTQIEIVGTFALKGVTRSKLLLSFETHSDGSSTRIMLAHEVEAVAELDASLIRHAWGELLAGCLRHWVDNQTPTGRLSPTMFGWS